MRLSDSFHPYAAATILFWSLAYVLTRMALQYFTAFSLGFLRYATASLALLVIILVKHIKAPKMIDIPWFILSGLSGFFLYMITFNKGCETVTAATSSVIIATVPVLTAVFARIISQERMRGIQWGATAIEFLGVIVLTVLGKSISIGHGIVWLLLAAVALSAYNLLQRKLTRTYSGMQASAYSIFVGTVMLAVFMPDAVEQAQNAPPVQLLYIGILGVFSSAVAYVTWAQAMKKAASTSSVSNYMFITPFLTTLLGFLLAGERPDFPTVAGGAVIMFGLMLFNFGGKIMDRVSPTEKSTGSDLHKDR